MRMQFRHNCTIGLLFLLIPSFFGAAAIKKEETKAPVISKKISVANIPKPLKTDTRQNTPDSKDTGEEEVIAKRIYDPKD
jgi:hypothetical protein